ncbi:hypothetical protein WJX73_005352 [Symbiochloris irregularis]|uniref:Uncharacterized protein n=1 Tax=Symbiochloris irregularis TaxID=706552 RepID=A0AAW1PY53_9CHLO
MYTAGAASICTAVQPPTCRDRLDHSDGPQFAEGRASHPKLRFSCPSPHEHSDESPALPRAHSARSIECMGPTQAARHSCSELQARAQGPPEPST